MEICQILVVYFTSISDYFTVNFQKHIVLISEKANYISDLYNDTDIDNKSKTIEDDIPMRDEELSGNIQKLFIKQDNYIDPKSTLISLKSTSVPPFPSVNLTSDDWSTKMDSFINDSIFRKKKEVSFSKTTIVAQDDVHTSISMIHGQYDEIIEFKNICYSDKEKRYVFFTDKAHYSQIYSFASQQPFTYYQLTSIKNQSITPSSSFYFKTHHNYITLLTRPRNAFHFVESYQHLVRVALFPEQYPKINSLYLLNFPVLKNLHWNNMYLNILMQLFPRKLVTQYTYESAQHAIYPYLAWKGYIYTSVQEALFTKAYIYKSIGEKSIKLCKKSCKFHLLLALRDKQFRNQNGGRILMNQNQVQSALYKDSHLDVSTLYLERLSPGKQIKACIYSDIFLGIYGGSFINSFYMLPNSVAILYYEENYLNRWIRRSLELNNIHTISVYNITSKPCPKKIPYDTCETYYHNQNAYININVLLSYLFDAKEYLSLYKYHNLFITES
ncbi:hypothetical protein WA158_002087 [Blastocystis sp. Blastoise]